MKILIIVPAYNEATSLERVIESLKATCPQYDYLIINDGSVDGTKEICEKNQYHVIHHPVNRGLRETMQTGMKYALEHDYDAALQFDADGQHLAEYIEVMVKCMEETHSDIVIGSRFFGTKMPFRMRSLGGKMISATIRLTTGKYLTDPTSGMRLYRRNIIRCFTECIGYAPEPDTIACLIRRGMDVQEVKVKMEERTEGKSYLTPVNAAKYMIRVLSSILFFQWFRKDKKETKEARKLRMEQQRRRVEYFKEEISEEKTVFFFR